MSWNVNQEIHSPDELKEALQAAIELEHATIPTYLCALFSIVPGHNRESAAILQSVVREEMLHMGLGCNVLNAIGGHPRIDRREFIPRYPGPLPAGVRPELTVRLERCSLDQLGDFMSIEEPLQFGSETIGLLYGRIEQALRDFASELFPGDRAVGSPDLQLTRWSGPGRLWKVVDLRSALEAIDEIIRQGEGASAFDPRASRDELAHYYRFGEIVNGHRLEPTEHGFEYTGTPIHFDEKGVWPMQANPHMGDLPPDSHVQWLSRQFNATYCHLLRALHRVFNGEPEEFDRTIGLMYSLKIQAQTLMQTPLDPDNHSKQGPNAGPSFEFVDLDAGVEQPAGERVVVLKPYDSTLDRAPFPPTKMRKIRPLKR